MSERDITLWITLSEADWSLIAAALGAKSRVAVVERLGVAIRGMVAMSNPGVVISGEQLPPKSIFRFE